MLQGYISNLFREGILKVPLRKYDKGCSFCSDKHRSSEKFYAPSPISDKKRIFQGRVVVVYVLSAPAAELLYIPHHFSGEGVVVFILRALRQKFCAPPSIFQRWKNLRHSDVEGFKRTEVQNWISLLSWKKRPEFRRKRDLYEPLLAAMA